MTKLDDDFLYQIFAVVDEIPEGFVATYGQIAKLIGFEKNSRAVGKALSVALIYGEFPCHRVVNSVGRLVPGWDNQKELLSKEKITFKENGSVDLKRHKWKI